MFSLKHKNIQSGFLLQKDVYTTNLLYEHNKFPILPIKNLFPFRNYDIYKKNINLQNSFIILNHNRSERCILPKKKITKLKFPLPKPELSTKIDFYSHLQGNIKLKYMDDDLNISSRRGKRIDYFFKEEEPRQIIFENNINKYKNLLHKYNSKSLSYTTKRRNMSFSFNKFFPIRQNIELINKHLKELNKKKSVITKDSVLFKTQVKS
jgi:hypothetical protein